MWPRSLLVRERAPLRLHANLTAPNGHVYRWAADEPQGSNVFSGLTFSGTMPGGDESCSCVLPRKAWEDYSDLIPFSRMTISGPGEQIVWQGRLETTPRVSGDQMSVAPGAVGYQALLSDFETARMVYVNIDMTTWGGASVQRQLNLLAAAYDLESGSTHGFGC